MPREKSLDSTATLVANKVTRSRKGRVFSPMSFGDKGSAAAIDKILQRLVASGALRRLSRGLYDKPRIDPILGELWPSVDAVLDALIDRERLRLQPSGQYAANVLGLSEQVPARIVLLTDGESRTVRAGPMKITLKRASPRTMAAAGRLSGTIIQALKSLGAAHVTAERISHLRRTIPHAERAVILKDLSLAPAWMHPFLREIAADDAAVAANAAPGTRRATRTRRVAT